LLSFASLPDAILHRDSEIAWVDSGLDTAIFNSVVFARFEPKTADRGIENVLSHFRLRSKPVTWHLGPYTKPTDLGRLLLEHGMAHTEDEPGMAVEIDRMEYAATLPGLKIDAVRDEDTLRDWVDVWLFPVPEEGRRLYLDGLRHRVLADGDASRYFVGWLGGRPVACSELFIGEGVASVQNVVTLPDLRRRGIGTAMTQRTLHEARALGYRVGVLTASQDGIGLYRRLGFEEHCRFRRFEWHPRQATAPVVGEGVTI
jgi:ribosomal protein S18 acetylase RimI-like enzyme